MSRTPAADLLRGAARVVVVPGYGLALAQAQHILRELVHALTERGAEVVYAIHPVAGRMPGHLNFLLDQAEVSHAQLVGLDAGNERLRAADLALVVGADDVVNPATGMPVLAVDRARAVVLLRSSERPGYAGIANGLLREPGTVVLTGDLQVTLRALLGEVRTP